MEMSKSSCASVRRSRRVAMVARHARKPDGCDSFFIWKLPRSNLTLQALRRECPNVTRHAWPIGVNVTDMRRHLRSDGNMTLPSGAVTQTGPLQNPIVDALLDNPLLGPAQRARLLHLLRHGVLHAFGRAFFDLFAFSEQVGVHS